MNTTVNVTRAETARELVTGLIIRQQEVDAARGGIAVQTKCKARYQGYLDAAWVALQGLGYANTPAAPFGLSFIVQREVIQAGPCPPATAPKAHALWWDHVVSRVLGELV